VKIGLHRGALISPSGPAQQTNHGFVGRVYTCVETVQTELMKALAGYGSQSLRGVPVTLSCAGKSDSQLRLIVDYPQAHVSHRSRRITDASTDPTGLLEPARIEQPGEIREGEGQRPTLKPCNLGVVSVGHNP